tara:strand:- start:46 stop:609 length:564 start_codon:yes stop_codon:yes gene_type:complete
MASVLDVIKGLNQAAANAGDYGGEYEELDLKIGLKREEGHPVLDSRVIDGFRVRFAADKMIVTYHSEMRIEELHPRNQFENEIEQKFADIVKFLKKEYKNITKNTVSLTPQGDADILVQTTSRVRSWVQATKQYNIGGVDNVDTVKRISIRDVDKSYEKKFKDFLEISSDKRPSNDKSTKNPDTPEA